MFSFRTGNGIGSRRRNSLLRPRGIITQHLQSFAQRRRSHLVRNSLNRKLSGVSSPTLSCCCCDNNNGTGCCAGGGACGRAAMWWSAHQKQWSWRRISLALCLFGFLREIRPSEPFVTDFMIEPWRNLTSDDVNRYVFPVGTYSYAAQLVIVFLLTDYLRYKPLIIASGLAGCIVWSLLIWTRSLADLQIGQVFYGTYMATEVAYYTYAYAKVDRRHYATITAHTRAAILVGRFVAATLGQVLVYTRLMDYLQLHYVTLGAQIAATLWAIGLPSVPTSVYFHRGRNVAGDAVQMVSDSITDEPPQQQQLPPKDVHTVERAVPPPDADNNTVVAVVNRRDGVSISEHDERAFRLLWSQFCRAYSNRDVLIWSVWYAVGMCGFLQGISYVQVLWVAIDPAPVSGIWNGAVEAINTLLGAGVALLAGHLHDSGGWLTRRRRNVLFALVVLSLCQGSAIAVASQTTERTVSYVAYSVFYVLYTFTITVASAEVAKGLEDDSYGLVFGVNTLVALVLQSLLTLAVVADGGLALPVVGQYAVLAGYFFVLAVVFAAAMFVEWRRQ